MSEATRSTTTLAAPERFTLVLQALPDGVPAIIRLRRVLKAALRSYGLRCVQCGRRRSNPPRGRTIAGFPGKSAKHPRERCKSACQWEGF